MNEQRGNGPSLLEKLNKFLCMGSAQLRASLQKHRLLSRDSSVWESCMTPKGAVKGMDGQTEVQ